MKNFLHNMWRVLRWPLYALAAAYVVFVLWDAFRLNDVDKTNAAVAAIHAQHITLGDVMGDKAITYPFDQAANDATVAGTDSNHNGIRDDVEIAIFKKYPNSPRIRAAELQYAMTEQMYLTRVYNTETWKAVAEEDSRAGICLSDSNADWQLIQNLVFNTQLRRDARTKAFEFTTSHGSAKGVACDVSSKQF